MNARKTSDLHRDLTPMATEILRLAARHEVKPSTIIKHALLVATVKPVPVRGLVEWNDRIGSQA